uniref:C2 domain-containing protein n=1 Tax=Esox lucius TaxID=8010 RepID=A0A3P8YPZ2_ESOLU
GTLCQLSLSLLLVKGLRHRKTGKHQRLSLCPNIITPDIIPEFSVPPKITSFREVKGTASSCKAPIIKVSLCEQKRGSPKSEASAEEFTISPHIIQVETVHVGHNCSDETTNADPNSQAALSLHHIAKAHTCYGFCTLLESPHTRRKESLFHTDPGSCGIPLLLPRSRSYTCSRVSPFTFPSSSPCSFSLHTLSPRGYILHRKSNLDSDTKSTEFSPFTSPCLRRSPPESALLKTFNYKRLLPRNIRKTAVSRNNSLLTDGIHDHSRNVIGWTSGGFSPSFCLVSASIFPIDLVLHRERVMAESVVPIGKDGTLRLATEYSPENRRLRVRLINVEGLYTWTVDPKRINCSVSLSLVPGKSQKQRSTVIRERHNPVFNEDFFFDAIFEKDLCQRSLRFKVVNSISTLKIICILGDAELPLTSIFNS